MTHLLAPLLALAALGLLTDYLQARKLAGEPYDAVMASTAVGFASRLEMERDDDLEAHLPIQPNVTRPEDIKNARLYAVFGPDGKIVAGNELLRPLMGEGPSDGLPHFHDAVFKGIPLRISDFGYAGPGRHGSIVVAESLDKRHDATRGLMKSTALTNFLMVVFTLKTMYFAVRHALRPLDLLSRRFESHDPQDLTPIELGPVPGEVRPLVVAANRLMDKVRDAVQSKQAFISSAAHQLRTPLAGLQTQLELLQDGPPAELRERTAGLVATVQRMVSGHPSIAGAVPCGVTCPGQHPGGKSRPAPAPRRARVDLPGPGARSEGRSGVPGRRRVGGWMDRPGCSGSC